MVEQILRRAFSISDAFNAHYRKVATLSCVGLAGAYMLSATASNDIQAQQVSDAQGVRSDIAAQAPVLEEEYNYPEALEGLNTAGATDWTYDVVNAQSDALSSPALFGNSRLGIADNRATLAAMQEPVQTLSDAQIVEALQPLNLEPIAMEDMVLYRTIRTSRRGGASDLLKRAELQDSAAQAFLESDASVKKALFNGKRRKVEIQSNGLGELTQLTTLWLDSKTHYKKLIVERNEQGKLVSKVETKPLTVTRKKVSGTVRVALFQATDDAGLPNSVTDQLIDTFSSRIDFHRKLRKGDHFNLVHESYEAEGEVLGSGKMLAAEFFNGRRHYEAMWFKQKGMPGGYYRLDGTSLKKAFLASPLKFTRITSRFGNRRHPISGKWKKHNGVDYAAPTGTPIMSLGDGTVKFAGVQRGYGNCVEIQHRGGRTTFYAHLHKINVKKGQTIQQKDIIGQVGSTGWSTGPHLHLEYRLNGQYQNPMILVEDGGGTLPLEKKYMTAFKKESAAMRVALTEAEQTNIALLKR